jgi:hypothetical protein
MIQQELFLLVIYSYIQILMELKIKSWFAQSVPLLFGYA